MSFTDAAAAAATASSASPTGSGASCTSWESNQVSPGCRHVGPSGPARKPWNQGTKEPIPLQLSGRRRRLFLLPLPQVDGQTDGFYRELFHLQELSGFFSSVIFFLQPLHLSEETPPDG